MKTAAAFAVPEEGCQWTIARFECAAAIETMIIQKPKIANERYRRSNGALNSSAVSAASVVSSD